MIVSNIQVKQMQTLTDFLHQETKIERQQKKTGIFVPDFSEMKNQTPHLTNDLFFTIEISTSVNTIAMRIILFIRTNF